MNRPLHVLLLEDSPDDALLLLRELRRAGVDAIHRRLDEPEDVRRALLTESWDVVLCDYLMPRFSAHAALAMIRDLDVDVPFIVVSGSIGEEIAVSAMKAGAQDYVMKDNLSRLAPAVQREVREAQTRQAKRRAEQALRDSEDKYRELLESEPSAILIVDTQGRIVLANSHVQTLFGYSADELMGRSVELLVPESLREAYLAHREAYRTAPRTLLLGASSDLSVRCRDGRDLPVEIHLRPHRVNDALVVTAVVRDVSERRRLETQLRHAQKMEAVGRLAGGVAHDFNNLLTAMLGFSSLGLEQMAPDHPVRPYLDEVRKAAKRAASLTSQLLAFGRRQLLEPRVTDLNAIVRDLDRMLRILVGEDIAMEVRLANPLGLVRVDPAQFEHVIVNLVVNARDAMPRGGRLTIETAETHVEDPVTLVPAGAVPGTYVSLTVGDTGVGMDAETKSRVFEPFFSTKEQGKGTGLGLSTAYGIVTQSEGYFAVDSDVGRGTRFQVLLPRAAALTPDPQPLPADVIPQGTETVLVTEDEVGVRALVREALRSRGYRVLEAESADEAEQMLVRYDGAIHLLVTDVVMPGVGGPQLAARLRRRQPSLKVLYMSGYGDDAKGLSDLDPERLIRKPFTPTQLVRTVFETLSGPASA
ncbi:MAG: response regulator [Nitrospirota bacterium]